MKYVAGRKQTMNGVEYQPGEIVPHAELLKKFRTLVSAGWLKPLKDDAGLKEEPKAPVVPRPPTQIALAPPAISATVKGGKSSGVDVQRQPVKQREGRNQIRDRGHRDKLSTASR